MPRPYRHVRQEAGFTLIEVLVALIIIAVGMLGIAKLQALATSNTGVSRMRSLAAIETASLASAMHANRGYWANSTNAASFTVAGSTLTVTAGTLPTVAGGCVFAGATPACTATQMAGADVANWIQGLSALLPSEQATVACDTTVQPVACTITISWVENVINANSQAGATAQLSTPTYELYVIP